MRVVKKGSLISAPIIITNDFDFGKIFPGNLSLLVVEWAESVMLQGNAFIFYIHFSSIKITVTDCSDSAKTTLFHCIHYVVAF